MTAPSVETAQIRRARTLVVPSPAHPAAPDTDFVPAEPVVPGGAGFVTPGPVSAPITGPVVAEPSVGEPPCPGRLELRAERLAARRERRRWTVLSVAVMAAVLGTTVGVLEVFH